MKINVNVNFDLSKIDIGKVNQIGLVNGSQALIAIAQKNSPYETGTLKKSIGSETDRGEKITESTSPNGISKTTKSVRIGPRGTEYAVRREFENYKNPDRKFYMEKTYKVAQPIIKEKFEQAVQIVIKSL